MTVFNRRAVRQHRDRAAAGLKAHDFLLCETAARLLDRLDDIKRDFPLAVDLGCHGGELARTVNGRGGIDTLVCCDLSPRMAALANAQDGPKIGPQGGLGLSADEEALPFAPASLDLILSNLSLHWVNDLPGALVQIRQALKPDGLFLACMLGGATLQELRSALYQAETEIEGGLSPRFSPLADVRDLGNLLQRAGFALPVSDFETITVSYAHPLKLLHDLRGMGESNANSERRLSFSRRATLFRAMEIYSENFADADGRVPATFEVITLTAWAPAPEQPQPLARGSAKTSLNDALDTSAATKAPKP
jgi:NADH dehydrogenase [ubiquinone] 1 alpha subcomplex assembly factor 5